MSLYIIKSYEFIKLPIIQKQILTHASKQKIVAFSTHIFEPTFQLQS